MVIIFIGYKMTLKKVGKTTRPFRCDLNQIPYDYTSKGESCSVVSNSLQPHALYSPWNSLGQNTGAGSCSLLQGIFPTQESNPG